jgi:hypothetical protein
MISIPSMAETFEYMYKTGRQVTLKITIICTGDNTYTDTSTQAFYSKESGLSFIRPHISTILFITVYCVNMGNHKTDVIHLSNQNYPNTADSELSMVMERRMAMNNSAHWTIYLFNSYSTSNSVHTRIVLIASIRSYLTLKLSVNLVLEAACKKLHMIQFLCSTM